MSEEGRKRIQALEQHSDLGAGFNIAMRDLEIRGAGDILGAEQSDLSPILVSRCTKNIS